MGVRILVTGTFFNGKRCATVSISVSGLHVCYEANLLFHTARKTLDTIKFVHLAASPNNLRINLPAFMKLG
jgi:hypothetical protein